MRTLVTFIVAAVISVLLTPLIRKLAFAWRIVDRPGPRKIHEHQIPRLGGVAVCGAWLVALLVGWWLPEGWRISTQLYAIAGLGSLAMLLGALDDWWDLPGWLKLIGQVLIATWLFTLGPRIEILTNPLGGEIYFSPMVSYLLTIVWIVGMMNAINLIDGMDGLACGIVGVASLGLIGAGLYVNSYTSVVVLAALVGSCLGFLRYNFPPAKIFLGDSGSQFLGFVVGAAALINDQYKVATAAALLIPLTTLTLPIYDTVLAIFRRFRGHQSIFRGDKRHLHHRLLKMGLSQRQVVLFLYLLTLYFSCLAFLFVLVPERYAVILLLLLVLGMLLGMQTLRFIEYIIRRRVRVRSHRAT